MVYKKKTVKKRAPRRKAYVKKPSPTRNLGTVTFGRGLPDKVLVTHTYHTFITIGSTFGSTGNWFFRANGMYDPDFTGGGHQPLYFDQLSAIYNHFRVIKSNMKLRLTSRGTGNPVMVTGVMLNDDTSGTINGETLCEQKRARSMTLAQGTNDNTYRLSERFSAYSTFGKESMGNDSLIGSGANDPSELTFFQIFCYSPLLGSGTIDLEVTIDYTALWTEIKDMAAS